MDRLRSLLRRMRRRRGSDTAGQYERIGGDDVDAGTLASLPDPKPPVSLYDYAVFLTLGCAMLWSWNMFMACTTYFQSRFAENKTIFANFQSSFLAVSCITNLTLLSYLSSTKGQKGANYPFRISSSLLSNTVIFTVLAFSTLVGKDSSAVSYFSFVCLIVFCTSIATSLSQNGVLAFVNNFQPIYIQAVMTGQGLAGVLPAVAQIVSVLIVPPKRDAEGQIVPEASPKSAFIYFTTAVCVSALTYLAFRALLNRHSELAVFQPTDADEDELVGKTTVPLWTLLVKLKYYAFSVFFIFTVTMVFPVFTQYIVSVRTSKGEQLPRLWEPDIFIPFAFLLWNFGDFAGRAVCANPFFQIKSATPLVGLALLRLLFIPLYYACNIKNQGALFDSDAVYWLIQLAFGFTNGWLSSNTMMFAPQAVDEELREATGGFMGVCLVSGLTAGSLLSFLIPV